MNKKSPREQRGQARVKLPERHQIEMPWMSLDQAIRSDHLVRTVVQYAETLDFSELYAEMKATTDNVGRDGIDPRMLFSLWLFATLEGENSARRIADLTTRDLAYLWICGGVSVNYHTLADFRTKHRELLENVLTDSIAVLHYHDLIKLETIAQDGMRVRASAGSGSFRTQESLETARQAAQQYYEQVLREQEEDDPNDKPKGRKQAARQRAAQEKLERIGAAGLEMEQMQQRYDKRNEHKSEKNHRSAPRASTTDPEARRMKMGDNGFRPAFNVQFANDAEALVIVKVDVTNEGSDAGLLASMYDDVCERYGTVPAKYLADGGFSKKDGVTHLERNGTEFHGVLYNEKKQLEEGKDPYEKRPKENKHYTAFRERMGTEQAKEVYRRRAPAAEFPNANCRNQGLQQFSVRGLAKTKSQSLWHALAYNFRRFINLRDANRNQSYLEVLMIS
jgi:transposase